MGEKNNNKKDNYTFPEIIELEKRAKEGDKEAQEILEGMEDYQKWKAGGENRISELAKSIAPIDLDAVGVGKSVLKEVMDTTKLLAQTGIDKTLLETSALLADSSSLDFASSQLNGISTQAADSLSYIEQALQSASIRNDWLAGIGSEIHSEQLDAAVLFELSPTVEERNLEETQETNRLLREQNRELRDANRNQQELNTKLVEIIQSQVLVSESRAKQMSVELPSKPTVLKRWKVVWRYCKSQWDSGVDATEICKWLQKAHPTVACQVDTLRKIMIAGEAKLLN